MRVQGLQTLRLTLVFRRARGSRDVKQWLVFSLDRPGALVHTLSFVEIEYGDAGEMKIEFDARCRSRMHLDRIEIEVVEDDNWRMHPSYPGGLSFRLPAIAPAGAIVNAINDALRGLGAVLCEIPATPERVLAALAEARRNNNGRSAA